MHLPCKHDLCLKCFNRLKTNPSPGSLTRFLNEATREPVHTLGIVPSQAYEVLQRPEPQLVFGDNEELYRFDREEAERDRVMAELGLDRNYAKPVPVIRCPMCRKTPPATKGAHPQP